MSRIPSLLRLAEHRSLKTITLSGRVLDLGGDKNSEYLRFLKGDFTTTTLNMSERTRPDILHNLEEKLQITDGTFNHVLLMNVLEHVFEYRQLLEESVRVLTPGGSITILVPFLFPVHPSPEDYHRFTASALKSELERLSLRNISIEALSGGVIYAQFMLLDRLLPKPLRFINFYTGRYIAILSERALRAVARVFGKGYSPETYALGYLARAAK